MNPEDPLAEQILGIQLIPSLPKLGSPNHLDLLTVTKDRGS